MRDQNSLLTTDVSASYDWEEKRSFFLLADQWIGSFLSLLTIYMQGMAGKFLKNPGHFLGLSTGQLPGTKGKSGTADKYRQNRLSTAGLVFQPFFSLGFAFSCLWKKC